MNKAELVKQMAKLTKMSNSSCKAALEAFINAVTASLKKKQDVTLTGFGSFKVITRKARVGVNPSTGKKMNIKAKTVARFKGGKNLADAVNGKK